ncbi:MAG: WD40/YVTN/BNR-like repeat-containing protein, partial [Vicinamibacteria bacterium]
MKKLSSFAGVFVVFSAVAAANGSSRQTAPGADAAARAAYPDVHPSFLNALEWRSLGPHRGGRATAVAGDPQNPLVFYFGASHGGVWKTEDAGTYWYNVSDGYFNPAPIGAMDVARSNGSVLYVGTGESCPRQDLTPGDGVYKSTDGGETWTHVGLEKTRHISKLRIHPTNPDIVYVAAVGDIFGTNPERGVYRTRDGGKTWEQVLYKSDQAGAWDLTIDPTNPDVLYASLNRFQRLPWDQYSGGPDSGLYKTTDGGDTWTEITRRPGLPRGVVGKIGVAISPARPSRVWALVEAEDGSLFRSDDSGETWQRINDQRDLRRSAPSYNHVIPDTEDPDTVYVQSYSFWKSTDGGKTFGTVSMPHGDHHSMWIDPDNSQRVIEGNDGGATVTLNGGKTWSSILNQPTACLFSLAIDDQHPYR